MTGDEINFIMVLKEKIRHFVKIHIFHNMDF